MGWLSELIGGGASSIIDSVTDGVDKFVTTDEERKELELLKQEMALKFKKLEFDADMAFMKDRESARDMYMKDSSLQKIFAIVFLVSYVLISAGMIAMVISMAFYDTKIELPDWGVMLISSVFTAMSSKVSSITDFLFGGSKGKDDSDARAANAFKGSQG